MRPKHAASVFHNNPWIANHTTRNLNQSRAIRIEALSSVPQIAQSLQKAANDAIKAIEDAKKFVIGEEKPEARPVDSSTFKVKVATREDRSTTGANS